MVLGVGEPVCDGEPPLRMECNWEGKSSTFFIFRRGELRGFVRHPHGAKKLRGHRALPFVPGRERKGRCWRRSSPK